VQGLECYRLPCLAAASATPSAWKPPAAPAPWTAKHSTEILVSEAPTDFRTRFLLPEAGVRGVIVQLQHAWQDVLTHADYPPQAQSLLGQSLAATALFTGHIKIDGRLSLQIRSQGSLRTLFAECTVDGTVRGIVQLEDGADAPARMDRLGEDAVLAVTIENPGLDPRSPQRYQSLLEINAGDLAGCFEHYFAHSEQLPTRLLLASTGDKAVGLMLQKLPGDEGDEEGWHRAETLFSTLGTDELLDTQAEALLYRLFHEESVRVMDSRPLKFGCSCSRERVEGVLHALGPDEAREALEDGQIEVRCEFCGRRYHFTSANLDLLFGVPSPTAPSSDRLQ
jgi:molecular chaperone Hsp33